MTARDEVVAWQVEWPAEEGEDKPWRLTFDYKAGATNRIEESKERGECPVLVPLVPQSALYALQAELDAVRAQYDALAGEKFSDRNHMALQSRARIAEEKHAALVAGVEGLADELQAVRRRIDGSVFSYRMTPANEIQLFGYSGEVKKITAQLRALLAGRE